VRRSVMRRCLKGLGGFPTSTDGFILGPSHGTVGRLDFLYFAKAKVKSSGQGCRSTRAVPCYTDSSTNPLIPASNSLCIHN
jgi:hypothetical protein